MTFRNKYDVENALSLYASSYMHMPAEQIYDGELLQRNRNLLKNCHIYLIGKLPKISIQRVAHKGGNSEIEFLAGRKSGKINVPTPPDFRLVEDGEHFYFVRPDGEKTVPDIVSLAPHMLELTNSGFEIQYIGQSYGKIGNRNAADRLLRHETLQKIALREQDDRHNLHIMMIEIQPGNTVITSFFPRAEDETQTELRYRNGIEKLYNTTDAERISLYEASLIRYFRPKYNKEFADSFPSTNLKILSDCYNKDFASLVSEVCLDDLPFRLYTATQAPEINHIAHFNLHSEEDRRMFFYGKD